MTEHPEKHPHYVEKALARLQTGRVLVRQSSDTEEAICKGNGFLYFTHPDGRAFPTTSAAYAIAHGLVQPVGDDLFAGGSQTYRAAQ